MPRRLRRQRLAAVAGAELVRAEGGGDLTDAAAFGHQEHPPRPGVAGLPYPHGFAGACRAIPDRPHHNGRGRPGGNFSLRA